MALVQRDTFDQGDRLSLGLRKPLRVFSGSADIATTTVDLEGYATTGTTRVGLAPGGNETDMLVGYDMPLRQNVDLAASLNVSNDTQNVRGDTEAGAHVGLTVKF